MWNILNDERLARIPRLYETEDIELTDKQIHRYLFMGGCDWYIAEFDGDDIFFGYAILNSDMDNAEWGYVSFRELRKLKISFMEVDCDFEEFWTVKPVAEISKIKT